MAWAWSAWLIGVRWTRRFCAIFRTDSGPDAPAGRFCAIFRTDSGPDAPTGRFCAIFRTDLGPDAPAGRFCAIFRTDPGPDAPAGRFCAIFRTDPGRDALAGRFCAIFRTDSGRDAPAERFCAIFRTDSGPDAPTGRFCAIFRTEHSVRTDRLVAHPVRPMPLLPAPCHCSGDPELVRRPPAVQGAMTGIRRATQAAAWSKWTGIGSESRSPLPFAWPVQRALHVRLYRKRAAQTN